MTSTSADDDARNQPVGEQIPWHCGRCEKPTIIEVLSFWEDAPGEDDDGWDSHRWTLGRCISCLQPHVFLQFDDVLKEDWEPVIQAFPVPQAGLSHEVPQSMREIYDEAQRCMSARAYTGAVLLARRLVEAIANDQEGKGPTLHHKLEDLRERGVLDRRLYQWSSLVREIGNEGAHQTSQAVPREDATEVLAFAEALADYLYAYRRRYERFQERRQTWALLKGSPPPF